MSQYRGVSQVHCRMSRCNGPLREVLVDEVVVAILVVVKVVLDTMVVLAKGQAAEGFEAIRQ